MIRHYFRIAIRSLFKQRILAFINISGLSLGLACFCLILLYAVSEFNFDRFHAKGDRIYRVTQVVTRDDGESRGNARLNTLLGPAMKQAFPDVEAAVRLSFEDKKFMRGNNGVVQLKIVYADEAFFSVFSFPLIAGNPRRALADPYSVVLTRSKAIQLFGTADAVGKTLPIQTDSGFHPFAVSAVAEDMPLNTSISFEVLGNYRYLEITDTNRVNMSANWHNTYGDQTFVLLRPGSHLPRQAAALQAFRQQHFPDEGQAMKKMKIAKANYVLQPLLKMHTDISVAENDTTDPRNIWILVAIASGILLIASINFTTLAIARSAGRAREVGVRKVVGGLRRQLMGQFLTESVLLSVLSALLGCLLAWILLPWFSRLAGRPLGFSGDLLPRLSILVVGLTLLVGLLAGFYPALVLSGFNTIEVLKAKIKLGGSNLFTRSLVTVQFVLSIGLIIATTVMMQQVQYMRSKDLGLIKENTISIHAGNIDATAAYPLFRLALADMPQVAGVGASAMGLGQGEGYMGGRYDFNGKQTSVIEYPVDEHFLPVMGMRLLAGRNFNPAITSDTVNNIIVNETLVHDELGLAPRQAIGQTIKTGVRTGSKELPKIKIIIGVVRDFNFEKLQKKVRPQLFMMPAKFTPSVFFVHLRGGDPTPVINAMAAVWRGVSPEIPFSYSFLDEDLNRFYSTEMRWGNIIAYAGGISIFLACLGLFGLAALSAANRLKEIGIRRILGASTMALVSLLTGGFLRLVGLAALIASPIAAVVMNRWLRDFAYRIDVGVSVFGITALAAMAIAFITIGVQAWRAARINPVKNLRVE